jgi:hypothetical protein
MPKEHANRARYLHILASSLLQRLNETEDKDGKKDAINFFLETFHHGWVTLFSASGPYRTQPIFTLSEDFSDAARITEDA